MWSFFSSPSSQVVPHTQSANNNTQQHMPRCYAFTTHSLHIHAGSTFCNIINETMCAHTTGAFLIHLNNFEDEESQSILVTVKKVLEMSKVMQNISSHQTHECMRGQVPVQVGYEVGKLEHALDENDVVIIFTLHKSVQRAFYEKRIGRFKNPVYVISFISGPDIER